MLEMKSKRGIASLPVLVLIVLIILLIGISIGGVGFVEGALALSQTQSREAYYIAELGINDALIKISRNKDFIYLSPGYCVISAGGVCDNDRYAKIIVTESSGVKTITSIGYIRNKQRKIQVTTQNIQISNGKIIIDTWQELTS